MEEIIDILDEDWHITGKICSKDQAHKEGYRHQWGHIRIYNSKWEILIQKRSEHKQFYPWMRHLSAGWHIDAGEAPIHWAIRELAEELHIQCNEKDLTFWWVAKQSGYYPQRGVYDKEFQSLFFLKYDGDVTNLDLQKEEVSEIKWMKYQDFKHEIMDPILTVVYVPASDEYWEIVWNFFDKQTDLMQISQW